MGTRPGRLGRRAATATGAAILVATAAGMFDPLPAEAATAGRISRFSGNILSFTAASGDVDNDVSVFVDGFGRFVVGDDQPMTAGPGCSVSGDAFGSVATCGFGITNVQVFGLGGNDRFTIEASIPTFVGGGPGDDELRGGVARGGPSRVQFQAGDGQDRVDYGLADRGVTVTIGSGLPDGRPGDLDDIRTDVEDIRGSGLADRLTGSFLANRIEGNRGSDIIDGGDGNDLLVEGSRASGSDDLFGGGDVDTVIYSLRTADVTVSLNGLRDDGALGELDLVGTDVENVVSGTGDDTLIGRAGPNSLVGSAGDDELRGLGGSDFLSPDEGSDLVLAGGGSDFVQARDGETDEVRCGTEPDSVQIDVGLDTVFGCETVR